LGKYEETLAKAKHIVTGYKWKKPQRSAGSYQQRTVADELQQELFLNEDTVLSLQEATRLARRWHCQ